MSDRSNFWKNNSQWPDESACHKGFLLYGRILRLPVIPVRWFLGGYVVPFGASRWHLARSQSAWSTASNREMASIFVWDAALAGFGVRVQSTGARSYVVKYRAGSGRGAPTRRLTLGKVGTLTPDEARTLAKKTLGSVAHGADPAAQRAADKRASTLAEVAEQFLTEQQKFRGRRNRSG
jgi:hypothetical protein